MCVQHGKCPICGAEYERWTSHAQSDSHHTYGEYRPCPHCGCRIGLAEKIDEILREKVRVTFCVSRHQTVMMINYEELQAMIMEAVKKGWPDPPPQQKK